MKNNILKYILIFVMGGMVLSSCDWDESVYEQQYRDYDKNATTFYVQFLNATASYATEIDENGQPTDIETTVAVKLLGPPQSSDIVVNLEVDASSTMTSAMYDLSSMSLTIPAGGTSSTPISLTALAANMPQDEPLTLLLNMDAGGAEAPVAYQLEYTFLRIKFCPLEDYNTMVGNWEGTDDWGYACKSVTAIDGDGDLTIKGLNSGWMVGVWYENPVEEVPVKMTMNPNGTLVIEQQYFMQTDWDDSRYEIAGTGTWDNCKKTLVITYDVIYEDGPNLTDTWGYGPIIETLAMKQ